MPSLVKPTFSKSCMTSEDVDKSALHSREPVKSVNSDHTLRRHKISSRGLKHLNKTNKIISILEKTQIILHVREVV